MNDFFKFIRDFLLNYLPKQKGASDNTIMSYKTSLNLFVTFMNDVKGIAPVSLTFEAVSTEVIKEFLEWIENDRGCSAVTRNLRLAALRSFFEFAIHPTHDAGFRVQNYIKKLIQQKFLCTTFSVKSTINTKSRD